MFINLYYKYKKCTFVPIKLNIINDYIYEYK